MSQQILDLMVDGEELTILQAPDRAAIYAFAASVQKSYAPRSSGSAPVATLAKP
jgi:hypothetical protein